ncbi:MAG: DUF6286 domain-containing protein [Propionibacteriaceae bacterium]
MSRTAASLVHRRRRTIPATISAVLLLGTAVVAGWAAVQTMATGSPLVLVAVVGRWLTATPWASVWILLIGIAITLLGLWWVVLALKPGPSNAVPVSSVPNPQVKDGATVLTRSALARLASVTATDIDGVDQVSSTIGRRRVSLRIDTTLHDAASLSQTVRAAVTDRLGSCGVTPVPGVSVRVRRKES